MKRDGVICLVILAYSMLASFVMFRPEALAAQNPPLKLENKPQTIVRFASLSGLIDPNKVFSLVNSERQNSGHSNLLANSKLAQVASARAKDMIDRGYYAHKNPDGKYFNNLFSQYGFNSRHSCENLDMVFSDDASKVVADWMASNHGHRECLTNNDFTEAGYAVAKIPDVQHANTTTVAYIVVAIHSTEVF